MEPDRPFGHDLLSLGVQWTALERFVAAAPEAGAMELKRGSPHSLVVTITKCCFGTERERRATSVAAAVEALEQGAETITTASVERTSDGDVISPEIAGSLHHLFE